MLCQNIFYFTLQIKIYATELLQIVFGISVKLRTLPGAKDSGTGEATPLNKSVKCLCFIAVDSSDLWQSGKTCLEIVKKFWQQILKRNHALVKFVSLRKQKKYFPKNDVGYMPSWNKHKSNQFSL